MQKMNDRRRRKAVIERSDQGDGSCGSIVFFDGVLVKKAFVQRERRGIVAVIVQLPLKGAGLAGARNAGSFE
nr:hypothetical protein [Subtercola lobariae]